MITTTFVLDANVFIEAAKRYYAFDIAPAFWDALLLHAGRGSVMSIDRVLTEIERGKDHLERWARGDFHRWFASTNEAEVVLAYGTTMNCALSQSQFTESAKADFARADNADAWVIAFGQSKGCTVVTDEVYDARIRRKVKIPNVCHALGVQCVNTFEMLRRLGVRLG